VILQPYGSED